MYYNRPSREHFGFATAKPCGWQWQWAIHPADLTVVRRAWRDALRTGRPFRAQFRLWQADGSYQWHQGRAVPRRDGWGRVEGWIVTCVDFRGTNRYAPAKYEMACV